MVLQSWSHKTQAKVSDFFVRVAPRLKGFQDAGNICFIMDSGTFLELYAVSNVKNAVRRDEAFQTCAALVRSPKTISSYGLKNLKGELIGLGAIRLSCGLCMSISGFTPEMNEAVAVVIADQFELIDAVSIAEIRKVSGNQHFLDVQAQLERLEAKVA